jgi:hypothetical protein
MLQNVSFSIVPMFDTMLIIAPNFQCTLAKILKFIVPIQWQLNHDGPSILEVINPKSGALPP